jgi:hypothetical protein
MTPSSPSPSVASCLLSVQLRFEVGDQGVDVLDPEEQVGPLLRERFRGDRLDPSGLAEAGFLATELLGGDRDLRREVGVALDDTLRVLQSVGGVPDGVRRQEGADRVRPACHERSRDPVVQSPADPRELVPEAIDLRLRRGCRIPSGREPRLGRLPETRDPVELGLGGVEPRFRSFELRSGVRPGGERGDRSGAHEERDGGPDHSAGKGRGCCLPVHPTGHRRRDRGYQ